MTDDTRPLTLDALRRDLTRRLRDAFRHDAVADDARAETASLDVRLLMAHVLGSGPDAPVLRGGEPVPPETAGTITRLVDRRAAGVPVARLTGRKEFYGLDLAVGPDTLVPRPDTETVVDAVLERLRAAGRDREALQLLDLGTGAGGLLLALLTELPEATGLGVDRAAGALTMARANARATGVAARAAFEQGDWATGINRDFDVVVSNPPYIRRGDLEGLATEVREHDPALALDGGADGLDAYRAILTDMPRLLRKGGVAALEIGHDQAGAVTALAEDAGFTATVVRDLAGHDRVVVVTAADQL